MWKKILISVRKNKIILFSFAALISFSFTFISMNIGKFVMFDNSTIIIHSPDITPVPAPVPVISSEPVIPVPVPVSEPNAISVPVNRYYRDNLSISEDSKLYSFVLGESGNVNITLIKEKAGTANASVYVIDVLNSKKVSIIRKEYSILDIDKSFETGYIYLEAGIYYIKVSQGSIYNSGSYKLWIRHWML